MTLCLSWLDSEGFDKWTRVILPASLPFVVSGMKQGWAFAGVR